MPRLQPKNRKRLRSEAARALLLATSFLALTHAEPLRAQETELRGAVPETTVLNRQGDAARPGTDAITTSSTATNAPDNAELPAYRPASAGALPDVDRATSDDAGAMPEDGDTATAVDGISDALAPPSTADAFSDDAAPRTPDTGTTPDLAGKVERPLSGAEDTTSDSDAIDREAANRREPTVDAADRLPLDPGAERTGAIEGRGTKPEQDPFAATGLRVGSFVLRPEIEQGITATSNADSSTDGKSAVLSETTLRLNMASDWKENSAVIDGYTTYRKTISGDEVEDVRGRIDGTLNIDLSNELRAVAKLGYEAAPESASSPVVIEDTASQPLRQTFDASLGVEKDVGKARFGLTGVVEHDLYGDADLSGGGTLSQRDRDSTLYTATLRGGYEISPALTPFAEVEAGRRVYDLRRDSGGYERSADRLGVRAGAEVDLGEKLAGEFSAGWIREAIDDDRLEPISGATLNADIKWSPERGTTVALNGMTTVEGGTTAGESGSILYSSRLSVERQIRSNLTGSAILGADWRDYVGSDGHDLNLSAEAGLTWWLNRYAGLTTRARTEKLTSNLPGRDATTNSVFVGMTVKR